MHASSFVFNYYFCDCLQNRATNLLNLMSVSEIANLYECDLLWQKTIEFGMKAL